MADYSGDNSPRYTGEEKAVAGIDDRSYPSLQMGFDELQAVTDRLHSELMKLEKIIDPIMVRPPEEADRGDSKETDKDYNPNSPLFQRLDSLRGQLYSMGDRIRSIREQVQL